MISLCKFFQVLTVASIFSLSTPLNYGLFLKKGQNNGSYASSTNEVSYTYPTISLESSQLLLSSSMTLVGDTKRFRPNVFKTTQNLPISQTNYFSQTTKEAILISPTKHVFSPAETERHVNPSLVSTYSPVENGSGETNNYFSMQLTSHIPTPILSTESSFERDLDTASKAYDTPYDKIPFSDMVESNSEENVSSYSHFHTPLMSLLIEASSLSSFPGVLPDPTASDLLEASYSLTPPTLNNELRSSNSTSVPVDSEHKKLLMLVLRAEDCSRFSKSDFEKILGKLMVKFGFGDVVPEISNAKCYAHLNINITVGPGAPTLRFLPNIDGKNNITVDVLNRTFRVVKLEKVDLKLEKKKSSNSSSSIINEYAKAETAAYICLGLMFGIFLGLLIFIFCMKICSCEKHANKKRFGLKNTHVRLRPEDYTLTPLPRPTSLYVDYYRGPAAVDIYSTTSAGSVVSTTPIVEQGVIQPFDTSIVPLEDSSALPLDNSRGLPVEMVPAKSDLKTFNMHNISEKALRDNVKDSKEKFHSKHIAEKNDSKTCGVANPTFQRY